jgi:uncharacterized protein YdbL (DUF1318 family)
LTKSSFARYRAVTQAINEQINADVADIARKEGVDVEEVTALRLDYKSIMC